MDVSVSGEKRRRTDILHPLLDEHTALEVVSHIRVEGTLDRFVYESNLGFHVRPNMMIVFPKEDGIFQYDTAPCHTAIGARTGLGEHAQDFKVIPWPPDSPDLDPIGHLSHAYSPRSDHTGFSQVGIAPDDAAGLGGFSRRSTVSPALVHSGAAPYSPQSTSSALKTSLLRVAQISSFLACALYSTFSRGNDDLETRMRGLRHGIAVFLECRWKTATSLHLESNKLGSKPRTPGHKARHSAARTKRSLPQEDLHHLPPRLKLYNRHVLESPPSALTHSRLHSSVSHPLVHSSHEHLTRRRPTISSRRPHFTSLAHTRQAASIKDCRSLSCGSTYTVLGRHLESSPTRAMRREGLRRQPVSPEHSCVVAKRIENSSRREVCDASKSRRIRHTRDSQKGESGGRERIVPGRGEGEVGLRLRLGAAESAPAAARNSTECPSAGYLRAWRVFPRVWPGYNVTTRVKSLPRNGTWHVLGRATLKTRQLHLPSAGIHAPSGRTESAVLRLHDTLTSVVDINCFGITCGGGGGRGPVKKERSDDAFGNSNCYFPRAKEQSGVSDGSCSGPSLPLATCSSQIATCAGRGEDIVTLCRHPHPRVRRANGEGFPAPVTANPCSLPHPPTTHANQTQRSRLPGTVWGLSQLVTPQRVSFHHDQTILAFTRQKAKSKYRNRIRLERASQNQSSDTHKTPYDRVKRCRERKINIKASERNTRLLLRRTGFDSQQGQSRVFVGGNSAGRCRWSAGFLGDLLPPPVHCGAAPYSPHIHPRQEANIYLNERRNKSPEQYHVSRLKGGNAAANLHIIHGFPARPPGLNLSRRAARSEVSMEQRRNEGAGETRDPQENLPTSGNVRHDSHMREIWERPNRESNPFAAASLVGRPVKSINQEFTNQKYSIATATGIGMLSTILDDVTCKVDILYDITVAIWNSIDLDNAVDLALTRRGTCSNNQEDPLYLCCGRYTNMPTAASAEHGRLVHSSTIKVKTRRITTSSTSSSASPMMSEGRLAVTSVEVIPANAQSRCDFTVTSNFSEALLKFYPRDIPQPQANKASLSLEKCTKVDNTPLSCALNFRKWESCRTMPLVGGFSRGCPHFSSPFIPALLHTHLTSPSVGSQNPARRWFIGGKVDCFLGFNILYTSPTVFCPYWLSLMYEATTPFNWANEDSDNIGQNVRDWSVNNLVESKTCPSNHERINYLECHRRYVGSKNFRDFPSSLRIDYSTIRRIPPVLQRSLRRMLQLPVKQYCSARSISGEAGAVDTGNAGCCCHQARSSARLDVLLEKQDSHSPLTSQADRLVLGRQRAKKMKYKWSDSRITRSMRKDKEDTIGKIRFLRHVDSGNICFPPPTWPSKRVAEESRFPSSAHKLLVSQFPQPIRAEPSRAEPSRAAFSSGGSLVSQGLVHSLRHRPMAGRVRRLPRSPHFEQRLPAASTTSHDRNTPHTCPRHRTHQYTEEKKGLSFPLMWACPLSDWLHEDTRTGLGSDWPICAAKGSLLAGG
ncbi:hypothetical protein PR048_031791 [Dryococelus australis]|uniref:Uncharacterized protein n=1 Tax=Dryococelus australis TaxID=614101 RepID=A0ABQ9G6A3_9NEOP|nr:hypothetical protein PR048_031791 [Dryococelus australis]